MRCIVSGDLYWMRFPTATLHIITLALVAHFSWRPCSVEAATQDGRQNAELLWSALRHATGMSDKELHHVAKELLDLKPPAQRQTWEAHVKCDAGTCAGEAVARLVSMLDQGKKLPLRGFEPFKGDPLYEYWNKRDQQPFHSWLSGWSAPEDAPLPEFVPEGQPLVNPRMQAAFFVREARKKIAELIGGFKRLGGLGRCLEWDEPFYIIKAFGHFCRRRDVLTYADPNVEGTQRKEVLEAGTRRMFVDILNPPKWMPRDYGLVVCLFVMEHVRDPHYAMRTVARTLLPGGFLLLGAPFVDGVHACPDDYFRYTPRGLLILAEAAGLEVLWTYSPGTPAMAAGELIGMKASYWDAKALTEEYEETHPLNVFLLARKPGWHWNGPRMPNGTVET